MGFDVSLACVEPRGKRFAVYIDGVMVAEGSSLQMAAVAWAINDSHETRTQEKVLAAHNELISRCLGICSEIEGPIAQAIYWRINGLRLHNTEGVYDHDGGCV